MARYKKTDQASDKTKAEALAVARSSQKPGQTKEQTKLIAQGIQKGIELYKKQQKAKAREIEKRQKKTKRQAEVDTSEEVLATAAPSSSRLPWILLAISWGLFAGYLTLSECLR